VHQDISLEKLGGETVPAVLHELASGRRAVECDHTDADVAVTWAREQDYWPTDDPAPVYVRDLR
jgi:hypothetical protein